MCDVYLLDFPSSRYYQWYLISWVYAFSAHYLLWCKWLLAFFICSNLIEFGWALSYAQLRSNRFHFNLIPFHRFYIWNRFICINCIENHKKKNNLETQNFLKYSSAIGIVSFSIVLNMIHSISPTKIVSGFQIV